MTDRDKPTASKNGVPVIPGEYILPFALVTTLFACGASPTT
jgi:hypothetical protein